MADQQQEEGYASSTPTSSLTWIAWFCSLPGHEYFCEVAEDFIEDDFNLTGLSTMVPFWKEAMEMVLDVEPEDTIKIPDVSIIEASAELLYGLVHQRYILTRPGLQSMAERYENGVFGSCLRVYCSSTRLIPCGRSDMPGIDTVKLYCPNCNDLYTPSSSRYGGVDGAFFGTTFAHLFFHTYREYAPVPFVPKRIHATDGTANVGLVHNPNPYGGQKRSETRIYVPKIYGFRVSERARSGPRMAWLRMRPPSWSDLSLVDSKGKWINDDDDSESDSGRPRDGPRERFDQDEDGDENIEEDEEEEDEDPAAPPPPPPTQFTGPVPRRPMARQANNEHQPSPAKRPDLQHPAEPLKSESDQEDEDSEVETPVEVEVVEELTCGARRRKTLAAQRLASSQRQDISQLFPMEKHHLITDWQPRELLLH